MKRVLIIGGGAAGCMAAYSAAQSGGKVIVLEKMAALGRKMLIAGKGRCNVTNDCDTATFIKNMPGNGHFLYSALNTFSGNDLRACLEEWGVPTKTERGGRVFPVSDQAKDVVTAFEQALRRAKVEVQTGQAVKEIQLKDGRVVGVITKQDQIISADAVILATGGASYPGTGSSGDGYRLAAAAGHTVTDLKPSLVPLEVAEEWVKDLQGLSLKNARATIYHDQQPVADDFGELLFTHYGLSGPIILSLSNKAAELLARPDSGEVILEINLKPALSVEQLDKRLQRDFSQFSRRQ
ncbi:MAG: aminoacetone oxidase family FAD-binding enzyme, partial [Negativicutes bacterium]|nr:aminoacetone oxidase family FAD-binding enzyme [Negativicutes bacterium]